MIAQLKNSELSKIIQEISLPLLKAARRVMDPAVTAITAVSNWRCQAQKISEFKELEAFIRGTLKSVVIGAQNHNVDLLVIGERLKEKIWPLTFCNGECPQAFRNGLLSKITQNMDGKGVFSNKTEENERTLRFLVEYLLTFNNEICKELGVGNNLSQLPKVADKETLISEKGLREFKQIRGSQFGAKDQVNWQVATQVASGLTEHNRGG